MNIESDDVRVVESKVQKRVISLLKRRGKISEDLATSMLSWQGGGGFSVNADVRIEFDDRRGVERLIRYCARPAFSGERLSYAKEKDQVIYELPKQGQGGETELRLKPQEALDRISQLIPPPRKHSHRYHGVLAPNAPCYAPLYSRGFVPAYLM